MVGALISPFSPLIPIECCSPSSPPFLRSWQLAHEMVLSLDKRVSLNKRWPSLIFCSSSFRSSRLGRARNGSFADKGLMVNANVISNKAFCSRRLFLSISVESSSLSISKYLVQIYLIVMSYLIVNSYLNLIFGKNQDEK